MVFFKTKNPNLENFEGLAMEDVGIIYVKLVFLRPFAIFLWPLGIFSGYLIFFSPFWYVVARKIWQPWTKPSFQAFISCLLPMYVFVSSVFHYLLSRLLFFVLFVKKCQIAQRVSRNESLKR
jgi:hypothetical protein